MKKCENLRRYARANKDMINDPEIASLNKCILVMLAELATALADDLEENDD